ncbi:protein CONSERVED IN THE GREEN LINEAGE AND DIATOMS 27, chloroplastic isoform X2 [Cornus florida]|uniref:protein CONSERVED IN THE GREEN LINEAGE AND DIATOMS 27, chloroplastic isoform X2 n=1 Tax=Cornus florida TaxID=4283 RepID=UPI0028A034C1|nr:protein CONSERVED IN THE GREEN LINEAGE AND DIATOMS 27, chloroplastic isoform X2 [Cornus florida]
MLRLNVYCSIVPGPRQVKIGSNYGSWVIQYHRAQHLCQRIRGKALKDEMEGGTSGLPGRSWEPGLEIEVPFEQRPEPLQFVLAAGTGTLFLVSLIVLRIYLGWSYVGDRLLSAVIPYEESGWYDGQMWVKPPEILARDRLLGSYKVKPVVKLLKQTLVGTGALLVTGVLLFIFATPVEDFIQNTFATNETSNVSALKNKKFNIRKEELLRLPVEVKADDDLAAAAAEAADGRPVYCRDRFYRALAGGQYCKWEDLIK